MRCVAGFCCVCCYDDALSSEEEEEEKTGWIQYDPPRFSSLLQGGGTFLFVCKAPENYSSEHHTFPSAPYQRALCAVDVVATADVGRLCS